MAPPATELEMRLALSLLLYSSSVSTGDLQRPFLYTPESHRVELLDCLTACGTLGQTINLIESRDLWRSGSAGLSLRYI